MTKNEEIMLEALKKIAYDNLESATKDAFGAFDKAEAKILYLRLIARECLRKLPGLKT